MMEEKLQSAANALPENFSDFSAVENRIAEKANRPRPLRRRRLAIVMVLAVLLVGCMSVTVPEYHLYNGNWWQFIPGLFFDPADDFDLHDNQTMKAAGKLGITLPETLGEYPIIHFARLNLTTREVPLWYAWIRPDYLYFSSFYGYDTEVPLVMEDGTEITAQSSVGADVMYGPTDNEIWRRQFGYDENDVFVATNYTLADLPVEEIYTLEHNGTTLYVGRITTSIHKQPLWHVTWVDYSNGVVFSIDGHFENPDDLTDYAKQIIDLNK